MNCRILHERPGRLRVHMRQCNMSLSEADRLETYLKGISGVIEVKVYERTADAVSEATILFLRTKEPGSGSRIRKPSMKSRRSIPVSISPSAVCSPG